MSFILEALKKSENKRRSKTRHSSPTIHEPVQRTSRKSSTWIVVGLVIVAVNGALLLWFFDSRQPLSIPESQEFLPPETAPSKAPRIKSSSPEPIAPAVNKRDRPVVVDGQQKSEKVAPIIENIILTPRKENKIYDLSQLPEAIKNQIPPMKMSLHAYNRDDSSASLVQLNGEIKRTGESLANHIVLEQITVDGIVLRFEGYRFLVPRRKK